MLGPAKVSDIVVRPENHFISTAASGPNDTEIQFFGLTPAPGRVLMLTGFTWGIHAPAGTDVALNLSVNTGDPQDSRSVATLVGVVPPGAAAGLCALTKTEHFPIPVPSLRGQYTHFIMHRVRPDPAAVYSVIGVQTHWIFGFWADDV